MLNISKWAVLLLSVLSLAVIGCGDDDKGNDDGVGGSAGDNGTAGTDEGTAGTDEGTAGTGGGNDELDCIASCDHTYDCGYVWADGPVEGCYDACESGELDAEVALCLQNAVCDDFDSVCLATCEDKAFDTCSEEGGDCFETYAAAEACAKDNGCLSETGLLDGACYQANCADEAEVYTECLFTDCAAFLECE